MTQNQTFALSRVFIYCLAAAYILFANNIFAQQSTFRVSYDIANLDITGGMVESPAGDFVVAGTNSNFLPLAGSMFKISKTGTIKWAKSYTGGLATDFSDIKNVSSGVKGFIATGSSSSGGAVLVRVDSNGAILWAKRYQFPDKSGKSSSESGSAVIETSDGGFLVGGSVSNFWDGISATTVDTTSAMAFKVDISGSLLWNRVWTLTNPTKADEHYINAVAESADGYFFLGASADETGSYDSDGDLPRKALLIKTNKSGATTYIRRWSTGAGILSATTLKLGSNAGKILLGGYDGNNGFLTTLEGVGSTPTLGAFNRRINGATFPPRVVTIDNVMEHADGNYSYIGQQIDALSFAFNTVMAKINSSTNAIMFGKNYTPISSLASIEPKGGLCADQGFFVSMLNQETSSTPPVNTGFNYNIIRTDTIGGLGSQNTGCPPAAYSPSNTSYGPTLSTPTSAEYTTLGEATFSVVATDITVRNGVQCLTVVCTPPAQPTVSATQSAICSGTQVTISASGGSNVTYKVYTQLTGGTSIGNAPINVTPTATTTYYVESEDNTNSGCVSTKDSVTVTVNTPPANVGTITGSTSPCPGSQAYSITPVSGASSYAWTVSGGGSITSGQGTTTLNVNWTTAGGPYTVSVTATNGCGSKSATTAVTVQTGPPAAVGAITANTNPCPGSQPYTIGNVANATSYNWTISGGGSITSGQGSTGITVDWTIPGGPYTVSVTATNGCGSTSNSTSVTVQNAPPAAVGAITGVTNPCPGTQPYSISAVAGATSYNWTVSGGGTIASGQGTANININWTAAGGPYTVAVTASNSCGNNSNSATVSVQSGPPAAVGAITGSTNPCPGSQTYTISNVANATNYAWTVSAGGTITAGQGTTSVTIDWTTPGGPYTVSVTASNNCGNTSNSTTVNIQTAAPDPTGAITGNTNPCPGSQTYTIAAVTRATIYNWTVSAGGTITSGQGSTSITVNWTTGGGPYTVSVSSVNPCGSTSNSLNVNVQNAAPANVGAISGTANPCLGSTNYSIANVPNATSYGWALSGGGTITAGQGTTSITVDWTTSGGPYTVTASAINSCGNAINTLLVAVLDPSPTVVGPITGDTAVCVGNGNYSVSAAQYATSYTWSANGGATIAGGQSTTNATINFPVAGSYIVSVTASNSCGTTTAATFNVNVRSASPTALGSITGTSPVCHGTETYTVGAATNATSYVWNVGVPGTIVTGQGTTSISVKWPATAGTYPITVVANNVCGNSSTASYSVTVVDTVPLNLGTITGNNNPCPGSTAYSVPALPNTSSYTWTVSGGGTIASGQGTSAINVNWTTAGGPYTVSVSANNVCGSSIPSNLTVNVQNGTAPVLGTISGNTLVCPTGETYSVSTVAGVSSYNWTISGGGTITSGQGTNSINVQWTQTGGPYTVSVVAIGSCSNSQPATLNVLVKPDAPTTPGPITGAATGCGGETLAYNVGTVANATAYTWTTSSGGVITSGQGTNAVQVTWPSTPGVYSISVTASNDCGTSAASTLNITVNAAAPVTTSAIAGDTSVCPGTFPYAITPVANATNYTWTVTSGGSIASGQNTPSIAIIWSTPGNQVISVTASNSCGSSAATTLKVNVHPSPTLPAVTVQDATICEGKSTVITASNSTGGTVSYNFYDAQTGGTLVGVSPLTVSPTDNTVYYLEAINQYGCVNSAGRIPATVTVIKAPQVLTVTAANASVCYGDSTILTATASQGSTITWWDNAVGGNQLGTGTTLNTGKLTQATTYYAQASTTGGCTSLTARKPLAVDVITLPEVTLTSDKDKNTIFPQEVLTFTASPAGYANYDFYVNSNKVQSGSSNTYASSKFSDKDSVIVIANDNGCGSIPDTAVVKIVDFPNVFSPNADGKNDKFLKDYDLVILNRWGQELYKGLDGWDGTYKGNKVAPGTYFYIVQMENITDRKTPVKGTVLLIQD